MLKAFEDKVIVKVIKAETTTASGFFLAGTEEEKTGLGTVVSVGEGLVLNNGDKVIPEVNLGQTVVFGKYAGTEVEHDGETLLILAYRDVLAVIQD
jgi:chaperonin GroES